MDGKGKIKLNLKQAKVIVRDLMPAIDPAKKVSEFNAVYKVLNWLESLGNWELPGCREETYRGTQTTFFLKLICAVLIQVSTVYW